MATQNPIHVVHERLNMFYETNFSCGPGGKYRYQTFNLCLLMTFTNLTNTVIKLVSESNFI